MKTAYDAYRGFCGDLVKNFDKDWAKVGVKLDFCYKFLGHIPDTAWQPMVKIAIDIWEGWPRNWVRATKDVYEAWRRDSGAAGAQDTYNRDDDPRYPVGKMWEAFWLLHKKGYAEYRTFADSTGMPATDRARVENKHRIISLGMEREFTIPEIGVRVNPKEERPARLPYREPGED